MFTCVHHKERGLSTAHFFLSHCLVVVWSGYTHRESYHDQCSNALGFGVCPVIQIHGISDARASLLDVIHQHNS